MTELSDKQREALETLRGGSGLLPPVHFAKLRDMGLVTKDTETKGARGKVATLLTDAGRAALS